MPPAVEPSSKPSDSLPRRFAIGDLVVDTGRVEVTRGGERVAAPGLSFDLLVALARAAPNVLTYDELLQRVWRGAVVSPETISQRVKLLRDALGDDPREPRYVAGVRGRGYRLLPDVVPLPDVPVVRDPPTGVEAVADSPRTGSASAAALGGTPASPPTSAPASPEGAELPTRAAEDVPAAEAPRVFPSARIAGWRRRPLALAAGAATLAALVVTFAVLRSREQRTESASAPTTASVPAPGSGVAPGAPATSVDVVGMQPRAIAVLPFQNLSGDPQNGFIGLGIAEMVLNRLASSDTLFVLARSSSFAFADRNLDAREIGRRLGARYLVQGSVQRAGDRLRVTAQLVDAQSGRQLEVFQSDRDLRELFDLQDELASQMAAALDTAVRPSVPGTRSIDAHLEYLQGLAELGRWTPAAAEAALAHFRRAQALDPNYAAAYAGEADALRVRAVSLDADLEREKPRIARLVERALALDPNLGPAYVVRAVVLEEDDAAAERDLRRAIALAPNYGEGYYHLAARLSGSGRRTEAIALYDRAIAVDPLRVRYRFVRAIEAQVDGESWEQTRARMLAILEIDPKSGAALAWLARMSGIQGEAADAVVYAERALAVDASLRDALLAAIEMYFLAGDVDAAEDVARGTGFELAARIAATLSRGDRAGAAALSLAKVPGPDGRAAPPQAVGSVVELALVAAILDHALRTRDYASAIRLLRERHCGREQGEDWCLRPATIMALISIGQLEILAGDRGGGEAKLERAKRFLDAEPSTYGLPFAGRARIAMIRGRPEEALRELAGATQGGRFLGWWITLPHDPTFDALRPTPAFQAILADARRRAAQQRERLEELRRAGQLPRRPATPR